MRLTGQKNPQPEKNHQYGLKKMEMKRDLRGVSVCESTAAGDRLGAVGSHTFKIQERV